MKFQLRNYQQQAVRQLRQRFRDGDRAVLFQLGTGGGKTVVFSFVAEGAARRGNNDRREAERAELGE